MRLSRKRLDSSLPDEELRAFVERSLSESLGDQVSVSRIRRKRSDYQTSFPLDELEVETADGTNRSLILKRLDRESLSVAARRAKPQFLSDPRREPDVYQLWLDPAMLDTPHCFGSLGSDAVGCHVLLLERIDGPGLHEVGDFGVWKSVAAWLARFHGRFWNVNASDPRAMRLLTWRFADYERWLARATAYSSARMGDLNRGRMMQQFTRAVECLSRGPTTLIHGEFFASNILIGRRADGIRVCPVDWEMAAIGPGCLDLAALVAGSWTDEERAELADAYFDARQSIDVAPPDHESNRHELICARLVLAVQRLGWADDWTPPPEHFHDWLDEALSLVARLETMP